MADMMRSRSRVVVSPTYGADYSGDFRARSKRETRQLIEEADEEIRDGEELRRLWSLLYAVHPAWFADKILDDRGIPKPPSRARRMP